MTDDAGVERLLAFARGRAGRAVSTGLLRYFHAHLENGERIPRQGGALVVSNHAAFGIDAFVLAAIVLRDTDRYVRFLVERNLSKLPPIGAFFRAVAVLPGTKDAAVQALRGGELVGVYPGGIDESLKLSRDRHRLLWGRRDGFAKVALRARAPIVPIAGIGIDDMYTVVAREPWVGRAVLGSARYDLPIAFGAFGTPLPRRARMRFVVCAPITCDGDPDDPSAIEHLRAATKAAMEAELDVQPA